MLALHAVDEIDNAILHQLQLDGRLPNIELAERVGLSPSPCLRRVRNLEASGVITGYTALIDPAAVGCEYQPIVWVTLSKVTRASMLEFESAIDEIPQVVEALRMMGQPDYMLRIVTTDSSSFEGLYIDMLAALPHVQTLTSQLAMKPVKRTHVLPLTMT